MSGITNQLFLRNRCLQFNLLFSIPLLFGCGPTPAPLDSWQKDKGGSGASDVETQRAIEAHQDYLDDIYAQLERLKKKVDEKDADNHSDQQLEKPSLSTYDGPLSDSLENPTRPIFRDRHEDNEQPVTVNLQNSLVIESAYKDYSPIQEELITANRRVQELEETISRLELEVESLQANNRQSKEEIILLNSRIISLTDELEEKESLVSELSQKLETRYYVFGTRAELESKGVFKRTIIRKRLDVDGFQPENFTLINQNQEKILIPYPSGRIRFMTLHGGLKSTYEMINLPNGQTELYIHDSQEFWRNSSFLVLVIN